MTEPLLTLRRLSFSWPGAAAPALRDISLTLAPGQSLGLSGANGSGKTTLFRCITGLLKADGEIRLHGAPVNTEKDFARLRRAVGFCLQNAEDQLIFPTVLEDTAFGPLNLGLAPETARQRARAALAAAGLAGFESRLCSQLSGGEQRLAALAGILAMRPEAILLDEPVNGLDEKAAKHVARLIQSMDCAKIIVAHDTDFLKTVCAGHVRLVNGVLEKSG